MLCDSGLGCVSPMMDQLLAGALCVVSLPRPFSRSFAVEPVESVSAGARPVHQALGPSGNGRLLVVPWSPPLDRAQQYAEAPAWGPVTIAHYLK